MKKYVIIAGANGAGKSTFYATAEDDFESIEKVNFDEIVRSIGNWTNASVKQSLLLTIVWVRVMTDLVKA